MTTPPPPAEPPSPQLAGFGARLAAKIIDLAITAVIAFVAFSVFEFLATFDLRLYSWDPKPTYADAAAYTAASPFLGVLLFEAALIAATARKGKTPGRKLLRIQVVSHDGLRPPTALRAIARWALPLVATAPLIDAFIRDVPELMNHWQAPALSGRMWWVWVAVGWWLIAQASALWDPQRRGWHDKAAGTIVVKAPRQWRPA